MRGGRQTLASQSGDETGRFAQHLRELGLRDQRARVGLGGAVHDGERETLREGKKELGSQVLFHIPIELGRSVRGRHRISLYFDHVSNASLADENEGLDTLGLRYGYLF